MEFRITDTFTDSLDKLTGQEQKAVKTTAFDLQVDPSRPGMQLHRIDRARDEHFWSVRANRDIRLIVHRTSRSFLLCYVGHHDDAYAWAERRKIERHPRTGAAQIVEIRETVRGIPVLVPVEQPAPAEPARADQASGEPAPADADPFEHPDALRRFRTVENHEELERALDAPWDRWAVFLHPSQRQTVDRANSGPARVAGSAGTGKTVVALHRTAYPAEQEPEDRILLTTFSAPLALSLRDKLWTLVSNRPRWYPRAAVEPLVYHWRSTDPPSPLHCGEVTIHSRTPGS